LQQVSLQKGNSIMAHELSFINGKAEAFYALKPAWHGLGTVLDHAPNSAEAIEAAHLDWRIGQRALRTVDGIDVPDLFANVREDTGAVLGVVSGRYQTVQNREAFDFLDGLLADGVIKYESAGALRGGRIVWLLARMPTVDTIADGDHTLRYVLFSTSHDGSASIHAVPTSVRVVCANTLRVAVANDIGIRHTGDVTHKLELAKRYLSQFDERFTLFRDDARKLATRQLQGTEARDYIAQLFPEVTNPGRSRSIRDKKIEQVRRAYSNGRQTMPAIKGTWWSLYNAVSETIDHNGRYIGTGRIRAENKMLSTVDGTGADFKAKAFKLALEMAS
jgi:phage/plasmid-like protein (TIGR03299 family)